MGFGSSGGSGAALRLVLAPPSHGAEAPLQVREAAAEVSEVEDPRDDLLQQPAWPVLRTPKAFPN